MAEVKENRERMISKSGVDGLSMEDRADKLHESFRRFVLKESSFNKRYVDRRVIKKEADIQ